MDTFVAELRNNHEVDPNDNVLNTIWNEYERVILKSLFTSFGLDFLVHDQHGGDVDTILNVRKMKDDSNLTYKNVNNKTAYEKREKYDKAAYHSDSRYREIVRNARKEFDEKGTKVKDAYVVGEEDLIPRRYNTIPREKQAQLDHVMSASEIHEDPGRVLAGLSGLDLANSESNLRFTNACLNLNMSNMSIEQYIQWCKDNPDKVNWNGKKGEPLPPELEQQLINEYQRAKKEYDAKLAQAYYTSPGFINDTLHAARNRGIEMGARQALGFVFLEIWLACKVELMHMPPGSDLADMFNAVGNGVKKGVENVQNKYGELLSQFGQGFAAGALASLTTTICNIFFTTAKNLVRCIRQMYASVVEAGRVLLFNPDELLFGERIKTASVILATGASVLLGSTVGDIVAKTPIANIPGLGNAVPVFCSSMVSGLVSCTLLIFLDRSSFVNNLISAMNRIPTEVNNYREIADAFEILAAKYAKYDIDGFCKETAMYHEISISVNNAQTEEELNAVLLNAYNKFDINLPWTGDFDAFMSNKDNMLVFE